MKWQKIADDESLTINLSQEVTISAIVEELGPEYANSVHPPYRSIFTVDKIPSEDHPPVHIYYKQHNRNSSQLLGPSTVLPVACALTLQLFKTC